MIKFGPSGRSDEDNEKKLSTEDFAKKLYDNGLTTCEYPLTYGTNISDERAKEIGDAFKAYNISLSVHAPYYINFATQDLTKLGATINYLLESVKKAKVMGSDRVVFHTGSLVGQTREEALKNTINGVKMFLEEMDKLGIEDIYICPETMGKHGQLGTPEEVAEICKLDDRIIPTIDFGHINAYTLGELKTKEHFENILDLFINKLNKNEIHIHFSRIEFTNKGEKKHLNFSSDSEFGPDYKLFIEALSKYKDKNIRVISESAGEQTKDSKIMLQYYKNVF